jgi:hypothetical protein
MKRLTNLQEGTRIRGHTDKRQGTWSSALTCSRPLMEKRQESRKAAPFYHLHTYGSITIACGQLRPGCSPNFLFRRWAAVKKAQGANAAVIS